MGSALHREEPAQYELERGRCRRSRATVARRGRFSSIPPASTSASSRNASGLASSVRNTSPAKTRRRPRCSALTASSARAAPSANGNAAESAMPGPEHGERATREAGRAPPLLPDDERERERRGADRRDRQHLDPEQARERVVEEAVGDERVAARVPEVVPDGEAVLEQERALVGVCGEVDAGRAEPQRSWRGARRRPRRWSPRGRGAVVRPRSPGGAYGMVSRLGAATRFPCRRDDLL